LKSFAQNNTIAVEHTNFIMAHTPLAKLLRHAASTAAQSDTRDATADDSAMSRREFVRTISYLEGAVETGGRAADEIISALR
jgi:hypothetical protein